MDIVEAQETLKTFSPNRSEEELKELMALARLLTYARETARSLDVGFVEYCLDMAVNGVLEDLQGNGQFKLHN